jgi:hypothetical protein
MSSSFYKLASTVLVATASLGAFAPMASKATLNWEQEARAEETYSHKTSFLWGQDCLPNMEVSVDNNNGVIRIQKTSNTDCQIAHEINLFIQDNDRPAPLRLSAVRSPYRSDIWIANYGDARQGRYRVMGIDPTPTGMNDNTYNSSRELGIDQVITIGVVGSRHPVADPPPVSQTQQGITTLDPESKQLLRNFAQWMHWLKVQMDWLKANWPQLEPLIRAIEAIQTS